MAKEKIAYIETEVDKILHQGTAVRIERHEEIREKLNSISHEDVKELFWLESIIQMKVLEYEENTWKESVERLEKRRKEAEEQAEICEA